MQTKTIQKTIQNKLNEWIESITDTGLQNQVKSELLLSGGSITSMFLNIPVNDYDIYLNDVDVLLRLVKYYTANIEEISVLDGRCKDEYLDDFQGKYPGVDIENEDPGVNSWHIALKTLHEDQVKLFFRDNKGGLKIDQSGDEVKRYTPVFFSPNAISLSDNIQIVCRFHGDDVQIHKTFDFIHATNYFTFEKGLVLNIDALTSILTKQLKYQGSLYPLTSIIRMKKFIKRGWGINAGEILKIMFQISELDLHDPDVLEEQLIGVDVAYFGTLIEILRGVDKAKFGSAYLNTIIDKVFNDATDDSYIDSE